MPKRHTDLFGRIASFAALRQAALTAACGKRRKPGVASFLANLEPRLFALERALQTGSWCSGTYTEMRGKEPKEHMVSSAPFRDRVVHHALCSVVGPIFEQGFIFDSYANRVGKGTHQAIARYEQYRNRHSHVLRADIYRYFPAIDHAVLKTDVRRRIACPQTLRLLDAFDHFVKEVLRAPYVRYVDDFALFHNDPAVLADWQRRIAQFLVGRRLSLHPRKTWIAPTTEPATFLGLELHPGGLRRLPPESVRRFRNRLRGLRDQWRAGTVERAVVLRRVFAWCAHARHAHTWRLRHALFRGGWFDPLWEPDGPPVERVLRGGSWNNKASNTRAGNRNNNSPDNRNYNNGFRVARTPLNARAACTKVSAGVQKGVHGPP